MSGENRKNFKVKRAGKLGKVDRGGSNLGRSIIRHQFPAPTEAKGDLETDRGKGKLRSVTQCDDLEELMGQAVLAGTDFSSRRGETVIIGSEARAEKAPPGLAREKNIDGAWRVKF